MLHVASNSGVCACVCVSAHLLYRQESAIRLREEKGKELGPGNRLECIDWKRRRVSVPHAVIELCMCNVACLPELYTM